ncbi:uncharacterized protein LOC135827195 [Sycon ciliatum]|uniref:uncharacterized protein LOC135827195 n=1 Tax=Sycon ciliatum TaxID=27933 RepID=UPI0031F689C8
MAGRKHLRNVRVRRHCRVTPVVERASVAHVDYREAGELSRPPTSERYDQQRHSPSTSLESTAPVSLEMPAASSTSGPSPSPEASGTEQRCSHGPQRTGRRSGTPSHRQPPYGLRSSCSEGPQNDVPLCSKDMTLKESEAEMCVPQEKGSSSNTSSSSIDKHRREELSHSNATLPVSAASEASGSPQDHHRHAGDGDCCNGSVTSFFTSAASSNNISGSTPTTISTTTISSSSTTTTPTSSISGTSGSSTSSNIVGAVTESWARESGHKSDDVQSVAHLDERNPFHRHRLLNMALQKRAALRESTRKKRKSASLLRAVLLERTIACEMPPVSTITRLQRILMLMTRNQDTCPNPGSNAGSETDLGSSCQQQKQQQQQQAQRQVSVALAQRPPTPIPAGVHTAVSPASIMPAAAAVTVAVANGHTGPQQSLSSSSTFTPDAAALNAATMDISPVTAAAPSTPVPALSQSHLSPASSSPYTIPTPLLDDGENISDEEIESILGSAASSAVSAGGSYPGSYQREAEFSEWAQSLVAHAPDAPSIIFSPSRVAATTSAIEQSVLDMLSQPYGPVTMETVKALQDDCVVAAVTDGDGLAHDTATTTTAAVVAAIVSTDTSGEEKKGICDTSNVSTGAPNETQVSSAATTAAAASTMRVSANTKTAVVVLVPSSQRPAALFTRSLSSGRASSSQSPATSRPLKRRRSLDDSLLAANGTGDAKKPYLGSADTDFDDQDDGGDGYVEVERAVGPALISPRGFHRSVSMPTGM